MVRLKAKGHQPIIRNFKYFNSKVVRLKVIRPVFFGGIAERFQFQSGSIKRNPVKNKDTFVRNFNSKVVRLKVTANLRTKNTPIYFNSKVVRLKELYQYRHKMQQSNFNSKVVRLKVRII